MTLLFGFSRKYHYLVYHNYYFYSKKGSVNSPRTPKSITGVLIAKNGGVFVLIIVHTISFRANFESYEKMIDFLGLEGLDFVPGQKFNMNYLNSLYYEGIKIGYNGQAGWGYYIHMSGKGCRTYEDILNSQGVTWYHIIFKLALKVRSGEAAVTRIDIAGDEFEGIFNCKTLERYIAQDKYVSRCPAKSIRLTKFGEECLYIGSTQSLTLLRIYNKKLERGFDPGDQDIPHWWRCELQLRDDHAQQLVLEWADSNNIGRIYSGHCLDHIRFTTGVNKKDGCQSRLNTAHFWESFLGTGFKIAWVSEKGSDYNMTKLQRYAIGNAGSSVKTMILAKDLNPEQLYAIYNDPVINLREDQKAFIRAHGGKI